MRKRVWLWLCMLILSVVSSGRTWYVDANKGSGGDGLSWTTALSSLQQALDNAVNGDSIWVATGDYYPEQSREIEGETLFAVSFELKDGVGIYGGFQGNETSLESRAMTVNGYAWEFVNSTRIRQRAGVSGGVFRTGNRVLSKGAILDGLVIEDGYADGAYEDGNGGGLQGAGKLTVRQCLFCNNVARNGGGIYWEGALTLEASCLANNELLSIGWGGYGGGAALMGDGYNLCGVLCIDNGSQGGIQTGGGLYLDGTGLAAHVTVAGNQVCRNAGGIWACNGAQVINTIVWGNSPAEKQLVQLDAQAMYCAVEQGCCGSTNIALSASNAGPNGIDANDNKVDEYFVCFVSPETGDYRLGGGSYALNRGQFISSGMDAQGSYLAGMLPADIGACGSELPGNLAVDFSVSYPFLYGGHSQIIALPGIQSPMMLEMDMAIPAEKADLTDGVPGEDWDARWRRTGIVELTLTGRVVGPEAHYWNEYVLPREITVRPRPLQITADNCEYSYGSGTPELTWRITGGKIIEGDAITGSLACDLSAGVGHVIPITQGTLTIDDRNGGANYILEFIEGQLTYLRGQPTITMEDMTEEYDGTPKPVDVELDMDDVEVTVTYTGMDGTDYPETTTAPTDAGQYKVTASFDDPGYEGSEEAILTILKAPLTVMAEDKSRTYRTPNPELTVICEGFKAHDSTADITMPAISTTAQLDSPVRDGGYPIELTGGAAQNYELTLVDGTLTIVPAQIRLEDLLAGDIVYGDTLDDSPLSGTAKQTETGETVPGVLSWDTPQDMPPVGTTEHPVTFVPEDTVNYVCPVTGTVPVTVKPCPLTVSGGVYTKVYGENEPKLEPVITQGTLVGRDVLTGQLERVPGDNVGTYAINRGTLAVNENYEITFVPGQLTITKRPVTITAKSRRKVYGMQDPDLLWNVTGGSILYTDAVTGDISREEGELPGTYEIQQGTLQISDNYDLTFIKGTFEITSAKLQLEAPVKANDITYGDSVADSVLNGILRNQANGQVVAGTLTWDDPTPHPPVGTYTGGWTFTPDVPTGYESVSGTATVVVHPAVLTVSLVQDYVRNYLEPDPEFVYAISGFKLGEDESVLTQMPVASTKATLASPAGDYAITISGGKADNYIFEYYGGILTVQTPKPELVGEIKVEPVIYGTHITDIPLEGKFVKSGTDEELEGVLSWANPSGKLPGVGTRKQPWVFTPLDGGYSVLTGNADIVVIPAPLTIEAVSVQCKTGEPFPELPLRYTGFVGGEHETTAGVFTEMPRVACACKDTREPGEFALIVEGGVAPNYEITRINGLLTIDYPTVVMDDISDISITYGTTINVATQNITIINPVTGEPVDGVLEWERGDDILDVDIYNLNWTFTPNEDENINGLSGTAAVTVIPKKLTVHTIPFTRRYGDTDADDGGYRDLWYVEPDDLVGDDTGDGQLGRLPGEDLGEYPYTLGTISFGDNYELILEPNAMTIVKRVVKIRSFFGTTIAQGYWGSTDPKIVAVDQTNAYDVYCVENLTDGYIDIPSHVDIGTYDVTIGTLRSLSPCVEFELIPTKIIISPAVITLNLLSTNLDFTRGHDINFRVVSSRPSGISFNQDDIIGQPQVVYNQIGQPSKLVIGTMASPSPNYTLILTPTGIFDFIQQSLKLSCPMQYKFVGDPDPVVYPSIASGQLLKGDVLDEPLIREEGEEPGTYTYMISPDDIHLYKYNWPVNKAVGVLVILPREPQDGTFTPYTTGGSYGMKASELEIASDFRHPASNETLTGSWELAEDDFTLTTESVGAHPTIQATFTPDDEDLDPITTVVRLCNIVTNVLYVKAKSYTLEYGDEIPEFEWTVDDRDGQFPGAQFTGSLYCGSYQLGGNTIQQGTLTCSNYPDAVIAFMPGNVLITKRKLTVEIVNVYKNLGDDDPAVQVRLTAGSLRSGDAISTAAVTRESGEDIGIYRLSAEHIGLTNPSAEQYYELTLLDGYLEILPDTMDATTLHSKVAVNPAWGEPGTYAEGDIVHCGDSYYKLGINAFASLQEAISETEENGVIFLAPGLYEAAEGSWLLDKSLTIIGDSTDVDEEIVLNGTLVVGSKVDNLLLNNLHILSALDSMPAVRICDGAGMVTMLGNQLEATVKTVEIGQFRSGVTMLHNAVASDNICIACVAGTDGEVPTGLLTLVTNTFDGRTLLERNGFSLISNANMFNGTLIELR